MLSAKDRKTLVEVGPGTPLGRMMRRYWQPIALSSQVAEPDGEPLRQRLLGENFVVFRDTNGKVGVLNEACPHRGVSLALGRNEEGGLRCLYHGWKFSAEGEVLETPNADRRFCERVRMRKYPVREQSGIVWVYIGPEELAPPFRTFEFDTVPESHRVVLRANCKSSYLPLYEGGCDISHQNMLHTNATRPSWLAKARGEDVDVVPMDDLNRLEVEETDTGFCYTYINDTSGADTLSAVFNAALPNLRIIPFLVGAYIFVIEVPMDDYETATYSVTYSHTGPLDHDHVKKLVWGYGPPLYDEKTHDLNISWANNMGQDRASMKTSFTGYPPPGIEIEDVAMSVSIGSDWDLTKEQLCKADLTVVRLRHLLLDAVKMNESGAAPPGLMQADMTGMVAFRTRHASTARWQDFMADFRAVHADQGARASKDHSDFGGMRADEAEKVRNAEPVAD